MNQGGPSGALLPAACRNRLESGKMKIAIAPILALSALVSGASMASAADEHRRPIVVAQEYLLPAPGPPAASCNSIVNAGADVGQTVDIDVSGTTGTIEFQYNTDSQPDRMVVFLDRRPTFDTGCLGTNGFRSQNIPLPEGALKLTVRVEPNCRGGSGTSWSFKLVCPTQ
jgi:hypothetical protein